MRKMLYYFSSIIIILLITFTVLFLYEKDLDRNVEFLQNYGWEVSEDIIESEEFIIPEEFDDVYFNYNEIQKDAGLDLTSYKGMNAVRYTYEVLNYPIKSEEVIRANVICVDNIPVAGDIMTTNIQGFMHSLKFPKIN